MSFTTPVDGQPAVAENVAQITETLKGNRSIPITLTSTLTVQTKPVAVSPDAGNSLAWQANGFFVPDFLTAAEGNALYATGAHNHSALYEPLDSAYTKAEADSRYATPTNVTSAITTHEGLADPHSIYLTQTEGDARYTQTAHLHDATYINVTGDSMTGHLGVGTTNLYDLGTTALRWRKLWAVDIESTNVPTVGGVALPTAAGIAGTYLTSATAAATYLPLTGGTLIGNLLFSTDNTRDIGASGATRPRTIYAGTSFVGPGAVPTGGTANQVLAKVDGTNYNVAWVAQSGGLTQAQADLRYLQLTGGNLSGALTLGNETLAADHPLLRARGPSLDTKSWSLEGTQYGFATAFHAAHLVGNAYWAGDAWYRYDDTQSGLLVAAARGGTLTVQTWGAGSGQIVSMPTTLSITPGSMTLTGNQNVSGNLTAGSLNAASGGIVALTSQTISNSSTITTEYIGMGASGFASSGRGSVTTGGTMGLGTTGGSEGSLEIGNNAGGAAKIAFHRQGAYAAYLGLDTDNVFKVGGWSMSGAAYSLITDTQSQTMSNKTVTTSVWRWPYAVPGNGAYLGIGWWNILAVAAGTYYIPNNQPAGSMVIAKNWGTANVSIYTVGGMVFCFGDGTTSTECKLFNGNAVVLMCDGGGGWMVISKYTTA